MKELRGWLERIGWGKKSDVANQPLDAETANHLEPLFRECGIPIQSNLPS